MHLTTPWPVKDVELPLEGLTVLIGPNGSGKSSLLSAILAQTQHDLSATKSDEAFLKLPRIRSFMSQADWDQWLLPHFLYTLAANLDAYGRVRDRAKLGLGPDFEIISPHTFQLNNRICHREDFSNGQAAYLLYVAIVEACTNHSLLLIDDAERFLHPSVIPLVISMLEELAELVPVVITTHSYTLLDALAAPEKSVVLCELHDAEKGVVLRRPDARQWDYWKRSDYDGMGSVCAAGYTHCIFENPR